MKVLVPERVTVELAFDLVAELRGSSMRFSESVTIGDPGSAIAK